MYNAQDEERAVCVCLNPFDVIAVELARHLFFSEPPILGEVRGDIKLFYCSVKLVSVKFGQSLNCELSFSNWFFTFLSLFIFSLNVFTQ